MRIRPHILHDVCIHRWGVALYVTFSLFLLLGCSEGFVSGKFVLADDSARPSWLDAKTAQDLEPFEIKYTVYETTFTKTGKVTVQIVSTNSAEPIIYHGTWHWAKDTVPPQKEGDSRLVVMDIDGTKDVYEFYHLKDFIRVSAKADSVPQESEQ